MATVICFSLLTLAATVTPSSVAAANNSADPAATSPVFVGAVGDEAYLANMIGAPLGTHAYAHFSSSVPYGRMVTVEASVPWPQVAAASPGSAVYNDIVRWANTIKSRPGPIMLAYHHEPEASLSSGNGSAEDFKNAWRRVVTIFRNQGVNNVIWTWQMTEWAFRTSTSDPRYAAKWYPGDAYVDNIGGDAYNWYTCGAGHGRWVELSKMADPIVAFARAHGKKASLPEFASSPNSQRAQWIQNAHQYLAAHRDILTAAFYFQHDPTNPANLDCRWKLNTSAEFSAYGSLARDPYFAP